MARPLCALLLAARLPVPQCYLVPLLCMTVIHLPCVYRQRPTPNNTRLAPHRTPIEKRAVGRGKREGSQRDKDRCIRCGSYWDGSVAQRHSYSPTFKQEQSSRDGWVALSLDSLRPSCVISLGATRWHSNGRVCPHRHIRFMSFSPVGNTVGGLCVLEIGGRRGQASNRLRLPSLSQARPFPGFCHWPMHVAVPQDVCVWLCVTLHDVQSSPDLFVSARRSRYLPRPHTFSERLWSRNSRLQTWNSRLQSSNSGLTVPLDSAHLHRKRSRSSLRRPGFEETSLCFKNVRPRVPTLRPRVPTLSIQIRTPPLLVIFTKAGRARQSGRWHVSGLARPYISPSLRLVFRGCTRGHTPDPAPGPTSDMLSLLSCSRGLGMCLEQVV